MGIVWSLDLIWPRSVVVVVYRVCDAWQTFCHGLNFEDLVHFMLDCKVFHPVLDNFPSAHIPTRAIFKDSRLMFILDHSDHVQVWGASQLWRKGRKIINNLLDDGREGKSCRKVIFLWLRPIMEDCGIWYGFIAHDYYVLLTLRLGSVLVHVGCGTGYSPKTFWCGLCIRHIYGTFCYGMFMKCNKWNVINGIRWRQRCVLVYAGVLSCLVISINQNPVCAFSPGPVFGIIVSSWTCMIMEFSLLVEWCSMFPG